MSQHYEFTFNLFICYGLIVSIFHLIVRKFISENVDSYNWLFYHHDFKYLRELRASNKPDKSAKAGLYHKALKVSYIFIVLVFIALMSAR